LHEEGLQQKQARGRRRREEAEALQAEALGGVNPEEQHGRRPTGAMLVEEPIGSLVLSPSVPQCSRPYSVAQIDEARPSLMPFN
jgi:hypothetical protein